MQFLFKEKNLYGVSQYQKYLVISTHGVEPIAPFDASYFFQDNILSIQEETGALLKSSNMATIQTPAVVKFE